MKRRADDVDARDDRTLVRAVLDGDKAAEEELVRRLRPLALGLARGRFGLDPHAAEEVWQEVVLRLWRDDRRALEAWRGEGKLTTYLTVIVSRLCLERRQRAERSTPDSTAEPVSSEDPLAHASQHQQHAVVRDVMADLSERDRLVLALRFEDEREPIEIGRLLGLKPATARKAVHDALSRLRKKLRTRHPELFQ
ncbi:MAG: sigma-70 family RNA polymerase sigma factor [Acidobacteriota bacterium]